MSSNMDDFTGEIDKKEQSTNIFNEEISPEEAEIISFINDQELLYETETKKMISRDVQQKFGDKGSDVLKSLIEDVSLDPNEISECDECGQASKEWSSQAEEKIKLMDICFDDELDKIADQLLTIPKHPRTEKVLKESIKECIINNTKYTDNIPKELIEKVKIKFLFNGIQKGWIQDVIFE